MKLTKTQTSMLTFKINKIVNAFASQNLNLNDYERTVTYSIGTQIGDGKLCTPQQKAFIDDLYKRAVESTSMRVSLRN